MSRDDRDSLKRSSWGFAHDDAKTESSTARGGGEAGSRGNSTAGVIVALVVVSVFGDLFESAIKRAAGVHLERGEAAAFAEIDTMRRRTAGSKDFVEGIASFREKRPARFSGE